VDIEAGGLGMALAALVRSDFSVAEFAEDARALEDVYFAQVSPPRAGGAQA